MSEGTSFDVRIDDGATASLVALAKRIGNLDPALDEIGASQVTEVQQRFEDQKDADGQAWKPLAASTLLRRKAPNPRILRMTGDLYDSVTHQVLSLRGVRVGSNRAYARLHQFGGENVPARPYLGVSSEGMKEIRAILADHVGAGA